MVIFLRGCISAASLRDNIGKYYVTDAQTGLGIFLAAVVL